MQNCTIIYFVHNEENQSLSAKSFATFNLLITCMQFQSRQSSCEISIIIINTFSLEKCNGFFLVFSPFLLQSFFIYLTHASVTLLPCEDDRRQTVFTCFTTFSHDSLNEERLYCNMCLYMFSNYIYFLKKYTLFVMLKYSFYYYCASSFACHK